jgi:hypothetical protein
VSCECSGICLAGASSEVDFFACPREYRPRCSISLRPPHYNKTMEREQYCTWEGEVCLVVYICCPDFLITERVEFQRISLFIIPVDYVMVSEANSKF